MKYIVHYKRYGLLRYLSNHENMRMVERILRRTSVPFKMTEGFHERMKLSFGQALPTGVIDRAGIFLISTDQLLDDEFLRTANALSPAGFEMFEIEKMKDDFNIGQAIAGYTFKLIFLKEPSLQDGWKAEKFGKIWIVSFTNEFNSPSPRPNDFGQFLTLRDRVIFRGLR
jgi:radical SAM-linked protein